MNVAPIIVIPNSSHLNFLYLPRLIIAVSNGFIFLQTDEGIIRC